MARSKTSIMNRALDILGATNISSPTDSTKSARAMNRAWDPVLDNLLERHNWSFAIERVELAEAVDTPEYEYSSKFALPLDYMRLIEVYPKYLKHKVEGAYILTSSSTLKIRYVRQITDPNEFSPGFAELLAKKLAAETCYKITQSRSKEDDLKKEAEKQFYQTTSDDSKKSGSAEPFADDVWMAHRGYITETNQNAIVSDDFNYGTVS